MSQVKTTLLNAGSLKTVNKRFNKLVQLQNLSMSTNSDIIAVRETWLNDNVANSEVL